MKTTVYLISLLAVISLTSCVSSQQTGDAAFGSNSSDGPDLEAGSKLNVELGVGYMKRGQYKVAKEKLEKAIEQNPENIEAFTTLALLMSKLNEKEKAEEYYLEAIDLQPNNTWLHNSYGVFLCGVGKIEDAMAEFKFAYEDPFYETAYLARSNAGSCLVQNGDYITSEALLRSALQSNTKLPGALLSMAEIGVKTKRYLMSRAYIQRYHIDNRPTSESLWLQIQAEKALKADEHYLKYSEQLLKAFPDSKEAGLLHELNRTGRLN